MRRALFLALPLLLGAGLAALAEEDAAPTSAVGLQLTAAVAPASARSGDVVRLKATFHNHGSAPVELYLPEHLEMVVFPSWRLVRESGATYAPHQPSFQSMWPRGLMGSILTLAPGEGRTFTHEVTRVVLQKDQRRSLDHDTPVLLPAGSYTVRAVYEQTDDTVPWALPNFRSERRRHEGLWTGRLEADAGTLKIYPSAKPTLHLEAPEEGEPGRPYPVRVEIRHAGPEPVTVRGALVVRAWSKAYGGGEVRVLLRDSDWVLATNGDQVHEVTFPLGATRVVEVDLARVDLRYRHRGETRRGGLHELIPVGLYHLDATLRVEGSKEPLATAGMFRRIKALDPSRATGLALRLERVDGGGPLPRVAVILRNESADTLHVPAALVYPRHVFFALVREGSTGRAHSSVARTPPSDPMDLVRADDPGTRARIEEGLSWNGDRWETPAPLGNRSFASLPPGGEIRRVVDLAELVTDPEVLSHGAWVIRAFWRNRESGLRLGLEPPLVVGLVESSALTLRGQGR